MEKHVPAERFNGVKTNGRPWPQEKKGVWCRRWRLHPCTPYRPFVDVPVNTFGFGIPPRLLRFPPPDPTHIREPLSIELGGNILVRRNTTASKKAAELAADFVKREKELQRLAAEFFQCEEDSNHGKIQKRIQDYQQKIDDLKAQSKEAEAQLRAQQSPIIFAMNQIGETPTNIIHRLGVRGIVVTQALRAEKEKRASTETDDSTAPEGHHSTTAEVETSNYSNNEESISPYGTSEN